MDIQDLSFSYPLDLIATESKKNFRILFTKLNCDKSDTTEAYTTEIGTETDTETYTEADTTDCKEINKTELLNKFKQGDVLVINNTKVIKRRIFSTDKNKLEILFINKIQDFNLNDIQDSSLNDIQNSKQNLSKKTTETWEVLCPSKKIKIGEAVHLPGDIQLKLIKKSIPQVVEVSQNLNLEYFKKYGQMPLPPYIQKARDKRENIQTDEVNYQTAWAKYYGSCAAPTASLHFTKSDLDYLKQKRKVKIVELTLHVGLGTFLPIKVKNLAEHKMHKEYLHIPSSSLKDIVCAKNNNCKIWALGTTVTRALETWALKNTKNNSNKLIDEKNIVKDFITESELFITPGFNFKVIDVLMTNFHQPESTLLAMLMAFATKYKVLKVYEWAIKKKFRLFSYGDLSIWEK
ncbi:MAG: S-adenosylmethionine:tRNA ribosyltransferase-isomerase [Bdellovibrionales bacterium]|nr:S-adenosylmethionine:tRNA ribosyltransferase-isomerase [Bdellovibrionales bacterium]